MRRAPEEEKGKIQTQLDVLDEKMPLPLTAIYAVKNDVKKVSPLHLLFKGDYLQPLDAVGTRPLGILLPEGTPESPATGEKPRTRLAEWVTDPANPLTARVMVNRVWQYHFGRGIVSTPILNTPELAIVGINKAVERVVVHDGKITVRRIMNLSSSFDHRFIDGFDAAAMIQALKARLEHPATIFID